MTRIEDQRILVWCNQEKYLKETILDAVYLALKLEREICLFGQYESEKEQRKLTNRVQVYARIIKADIPHLSVSTLLLKGTLPQIIPELGKTYNAILFCCSGKMNSTLLKAFHLSGFPFYFRKKSTTPVQRFKKVVIPIDFRNSTKDATLWGSYFGRFNQSEITLKIAHDSKDKEMRNKVEKNVAFVRKFYDQFSFPFKFENGKSGSWGIHLETMKNSNNFDLLIFPGSLNITLLDRIWGPFEKRIVNHSKISILLCNPQKEMYILCN